jgi:hypothetical protein
MILGVRSVRLLKIVACHAGARRLPGLHQLSPYGGESVAGPWPHSHRHLEAFVGVRGAKTPGSWEGRSLATSDWLTVGHCSLLHGRSLSESRPTSVIRTRRDRDWRLSPGPATSPNTSGVA